MFAISFFRRARRWLLALLFGLAILPAAQAHLMVAQRGTLNLMDAGAFIVLSLPVSAFSGVDDDGDGMLSPTELRQHAAALEDQVQRGVQLRHGSTVLPMQGVMMQLSPDDHSPGIAASQIIVLGRFALGSGQDGLHLRLSLYGNRPAEQSQQMTVSRGGEAQQLLLSKARSEADLLPSAWTKFVGVMRQFVRSALRGPDHASSQRTARSGST